MRLNGDLLIDDDLTVSGDATVAAPTAVVNVNDTSGAVNAKNWQVQAHDGVLDIHAHTDAGAVQAVALTCYRNGNIETSGSMKAYGGLETTPLNASQLTSGTVPAARLPANVVLTDKVNSFASTFFIQNNAPGYGLVETDQPADQRNWYYAVENQVLRLTVNNDAMAAIALGFSVNRSGDVSVGRDLYEKNRTVPMGHWTAFTPTLAQATLGTVFTCMYMLLGKSCFLTFYLAVDVPAGTTSWQIALPAGIVGANYTGVPFSDSNGFGGMVHSVPGSASLLLYRDTTGNTLWPVGAHTVATTTCFPIQ